LPPDLDLLCVCFRGAASLSSRMWPYYSIPCALHRFPVPSVACLHFCRIGVPSCIFHSPLGILQSTKITQSELPCPMYSLL
ncbi:hypothetical protein B0H10DRAFT_2039828, partial [Mycena sp. CBHHK59/15]